MLLNTDVSNHHDEDEDISFDAGLGRALRVGTCIAVIGHRPSLFSQPRSCPGASLSPRWWFATSRAERAATSDPTSDSATRGAAGCSAKSDPAARDPAAGHPTKS